MSIDVKRILLYQSKLIAAKTQLFVNLKYTMKPDVVGKITKITI
jgi:hypothetical protein